MRLVLFVYVSIVPENKLTLLDFSQRLSSQDRLRARARATVSAMRIFGL